MRKSIFYLGLVLLFLGIILMFSSPNCGLLMARSYLRNSAGGSMDANQYVVIMEGYIAAVRATGFLLSLLGGLCSAFILLSQKCLSGSRHD